MERRALLVEWRELLELQVEWRALLLPLVGWRELLELQVEWRELLVQLVEWRELLEKGRALLELVVQWVQKNVRPQVLIMVENLVVDTPPSGEASIMLHSRAKVPTINRMWCPGFSHLL